MHIDTFITCVGENSRKFLTITLGFNKKFFDNTYIITTEEDIETQKFCESAGVDCLTTDLFTKEFNGQPAVFNRGAVLNTAFEIVQPKDFVCSMDCDILIKDDFLKWKEEIYHTHGPLTAFDNFYGMPRVIIPTIKDLLELIHGKVEESKFVSYPAVGHGYFQLWNVKSYIIKSGLFSYPESYNSAESDWQWRNLWGETIEGDTKQTNLLKNIGITCLHLGEPNIEKNQNFWN